MKGRDAAGNGIWCVRDRTSGWGKGPTANAKWLWRGRTGVAGGRASGWRGWPGGGGRTRLDAQDMHYMHYEPIHCARPEDAPPYTGGGCCGAVLTTPYPVTSALSTGTFYFNQPPAADELIVHFTTAAAKHPLAFSCIVAVSPHAIRSKVPRSISICHGRSLTY